MRHAARKAAKTSSTSRRSRLAHAALKVKSEKTEGNGAVIGLDAAVLDKLNEIAPMSRRSMREAARAAERHNMLMGSASLAALVGTAAAAMAFANPDEHMTLASDASTTTTQMQRVSAAASRSDVRSSLDALDTATSATQQTSNEGVWSLGDANADLDITQMSRSLASNPNVAKLMDEDNGKLPSGFNPNHATGDNGNAYEEGQCTWWAYVRRQQLGLPVGSQFGNANMWASSARSLGYWVDNTPRHVGDVVVFASGQEGASSTYGHVAIVEKINDDGSITISECNVSGKSGTSTRTLSKVSDFEYIHY